MPYFNFWKRTGAPWLHFDSTNHQLTPEDLPSIERAMADETNWRIEFVPRIFGKSLPRLMLCVTRNQYWPIAEFATAGFARLFKTAITVHRPREELLQRAWLHLRDSADPKARRLAHEITLSLGNL